MPESAITQIDLTPVSRFIGGPIYGAEVSLTPNASDPLYDYLLEVEDQPGARPFFSGFEFDLTTQGGTEGSTTYFGDFQIDELAITVVDLNNTTGTLTEAEKDALRPLILDRISIRPGRTSDATELSLGVLDIAAQGVKTIKLNVPFQDVGVQSTPGEVDIDFFSIDASSTSLSEFTVSVTSSQLRIDAGLTDITEPALLIEKSPTIGSTFTSVSAEIISDSPNNQLRLEAVRSITSGQDAAQGVYEGPFEHLRVSGVSVSEFASHVWDSSESELGIYINRYFTGLTQPVQFVPAAYFMSIPDGDGYNPYSVGGSSSEWRTSFPGTSRFITFRMRPVGVGGSNPTFEKVWSVTNTSSTKVFTIEFFQGAPPSISWENRSITLTVSDGTQTQSYTRTNGNIQSSFAHVDDDIAFELFDDIMADFPDLEFRFATYADRGFTNGSSGVLQTGAAAGGYDLDNEEIEAYRYWKAVWLKRPDVGPLVEDTGSQRRELTLAPGVSFDDGDAMCPNNLYTFNVAFSSDDWTGSGSNDTISLEEMADKIRRTISGFGIEMNYKFISDWGDKVFISDIAFVASPGAYTNIRQADPDNPSSLPNPAITTNITNDLSAGHQFSTTSPGNPISNLGYELSANVYDASLFTNIGSFVNGINIGIATQSTETRWVYEAIPGFEAVSTSSVVPASDSSIAYPGPFAPIDITSGSTVNIASTFELDTDTIQSLVTEINQDAAGWIGLVSVSVFPGNESRQQDTLNVTAEVEMISGSQFIATTTYQENLIETFAFSDYASTPLGVQVLYDEIKDAFQADSGNPFNLGFTYLLDNGRYPEASPSAIGQNPFNEDISLLGGARTFVGTFTTTSTVEGPIVNFEVDYNIQFAGAPDVGGGEQGIQIALGGYVKDGTLFANQSPNTWFEPGYNTQLPIQFDVTDADTVLLLVRTRTNFEGTDFDLDPTHYTVQVNYSDGSSDPNVVPSVPTTPPYSQIWVDDFGEGVPETPVVLQIDSPAAFMDVIVNDGVILESSVIRINDIPEQIDQFAFVALNRSNLNSPNGQRISRQGRSFGLVLDAQGVWDILIGPEAELQRIDSDPDFSYLGIDFERTSLDADDAYDFFVDNQDSLPQDVIDSISLVPVVNYPQVWALRIGPGVKQYLAAQRAAASEGSLDGCSVDIDLLAVARNFDEIRGTCRVSVFFDFTCVFDLQLCDFFWNLNEPPTPQEKEEINNQISTSYRNLIDCNVIATIDDPDIDNIELDMPVLITVDNVPTFENGNALLLIKSRYSEVVQSFRRPTVFDNMQFENCEFLATDIPLVTKLNRPILINDMGQELVDPIDIIEGLTTLDSYLWIQPKFQFPPVDISKELGADEIVVFGIGYTFKNWFNGLRSDVFLTEIGLKLPSGLITQPDLDFSHKYYYNQDES